MRTWMLALALAIVAAGCAGDDLTGTPVPNMLPDTKLVSTPPTQVAGGYTVRFAWTGSDVDGQVQRFQWKLCPIGRDGIDVHDTLTCDPATGQQLHPWCVTAGTDTVVMVRADRPPEPDAPPLEAGLFTETHTFLVRAQDDRGGLDPTPDFVSFTASTIAPRIRVDRPERILNQVDARAMPPTAVFGYTGIDPDFERGTPTRVRYLFKTAWWQDHYVGTRYEFDRLRPQLIDGEDPAWSAWFPYPEHPDDRQITLPDLPAYDDQERRIRYLFALQCADTAGAVSVDWTYGRNVVNFFVSAGLTPLLTMRETYLGTRQATGTRSRVTVDIATGQPLRFSWHASAADYNGTIASYRWGWDVYDPDDPADPGWAVPPGLGAEQLGTPETVLGAGTHTLTIQVRDTAAQLTRFVWVLETVPVPDFDQLPVLLVDDVPDRTSLAWPAADGATPLDNDMYRDAFWLEALQGSGGVLGFDPARDVVDLEAEEIAYRRLVEYRTVVWTTRYARDNGIWRLFKPYSDGSARYIWLEAYQQSVGDLLLVGPRVMREFLEERLWLVPIVFDTDVEILPGYVGPGPAPYAGFGIGIRPDGTSYLRGRERYPYRAAGLALLDLVAPRQERVWGCVSWPGLGSCARRSECAGTKALVLDGDFAARHPDLAAALPESLPTEARIDWRDGDPAYGDALLTWHWGDTEFYDANIASRPTPWQPQDCAGEPCLEPMFRSVSRLDWVAERHAAAGDPDWPGSSFTPEELSEICGSRTLDEATGRSLTSDLPVGFVSRKLAATKPSRRGDVFWGFDPYRFDHAGAQAAIRWVLTEHFCLVARP